MLSLYVLNVVKAYDSIVSGRPQYLCVASSMKIYVVPEFGSDGIYCCHWMVFSLHDIVESLGAKAYA